MNVERPKLTKSETILLDNILDNGLLPAHERVVGALNDAIKGFLNSSTVSSDDMMDAYKLLKLVVSPAYVGGSEYLSINSKTSAFGAGHIIDPEKRSVYSGEKAARLCCMMLNSSEGMWIGSGILNISHNKLNGPDMVLRAYDPFEKEWGKSEYQDARQTFMNYIGYLSDNVFLGDVKIEHQNRVEESLFSMQSPYTRHKIDYLFNVTNFSNWYLDTLQRIKDNGVSIGSEPAKMTRETISSISKIPSGIHDIVHTQ
jgi:hypothetical protein